MKLIKLDAIDSTNEFLKGLSKVENLENFTVVAANKQTNGKGQMGSIWTTEDSKNLIISILIKHNGLKIDSIYNLNVLVAVSCIAILKDLKIPNLNIKWPNDIMAENKKIGGILIENVLKNNTVAESVVGIGLNINQINFENLPKASSLKKITKEDFNIDNILEKIVLQIESNYGLLQKNEVATLWDFYDQYLFRKNRVSVFENDKNERFSGILKSVNLNGQLEVLLENDLIAKFNVKEISLIY